MIGKTISHYRILGAKHSGGDSVKDGISPTGNASPLLCLFGDVVDGEMHLNDAGKIVDEVWREIPRYYPGVDTDEHSVMPNHLHSIIILNNEDVGASPCGRPMMDDNWSG